jgi:voltage-gated sodium channel
VYYYKKQYFDSKWNWIDASLVMISFVPLLLQIFSVETIAIVGNAIMLRTFRLFKLFRTIKIIPGLDKIYADLKNAIKVTYGMIFGGLILLTILGVLLCLIFKEFDPVNFEDPFVSIYSVFRLFSVEGWYEIPDAMCARSSYLNATLIRISFSLIVLLGIFILGFIISSMSDELTMDNNDELMKKTNDLEEKIDRLTEKIDLLIAKE